ncbi:hypothetical protein EVAR_96772_1 [Eumeta japonica]|uniref:Uncharacterized protein n=1 Tax=Eumeta variegata TaxID=151549 RepID=A0A4C1WUT0_EUMVA|nr:hypothetical protein EVAR_96772_1 [Eumeta japonica]
MPREDQDRYGDPYWNQEQTGTGPGSGTRIDIENMTVNVIKIDNKISRYRRARAASDSVTEQRSGSSVDVRDEGVRSMSTQVETRAEASPCPSLITELDFER